MPPSSVEKAEAALGGPARTDVVALGVSELLQRYCRARHSDGTNGEGFAGGFDIGELIARGRIVPGSSEASPLVKNFSTRRRGSPGCRPALGGAFAPALCALRTRNRPATCP